MTEKYFNTYKDYKQAKNLPPPETPRNGAYGEEL